MRGFAPVFAVALVFTSLLGFVSAGDLFGLRSASSTIAVQISTLDTPPGVDLGVSEYSDDKDGFYKPYLKDAWEKGIQAKSQAAEMVRIVETTKVAFDAAKNLLTLSFNRQAYNYEARAKELFKEAVRHSYETFYGLTDLIKSDADDLDRMGADNENYSGIAQQRYRKAAGLIGALFPEPCDGCIPVIEVNPCTLIDITSKSVCVKRQIGLDSADPAFVAGVYNSVVGYGGNSLLKDYRRFHGELGAAKAEMAEEYRSAAAYFDEQLAALRQKLSQLGSDGIEKVTQRVMNAITAADPLGGGVVAESASSLSEDFALINSQEGPISAKKSAAEQLVSEKNEDYLFNAAALLDDGNIMLRDYNGRVRQLAQQLDSLYYRARDVCSRLKEANSAKASNDIYLQALGHSGNADAAPTKGEAIAEYGAAIELFSVVGEYENPELAGYDEDVRRIDEIIESLDEAGADVSLEKMQYQKLLQIKDNALLPQVIETAESLREKLEIKFSSLLAQIDGLREEASDYLGTAALFLGEPSLSQHLNTTEISGLQRDYELSATKDPLSHAGELYTTYSDIINYLKPKVDSLASHFLSGTTVLKIFSADPCGKSTIIAEVTNPSLVRFVGVSISKKLNSSLRVVEGASYADGVLSFLIDEIYPGQTKGLVFSAYGGDCFQSKEFEIIGAPEKSSSALAAETELLRLDERISKICLFINCTGLRTAYGDVRAAWERTGLLNASLLEQEINEAAGALMAEFVGGAASARIAALDGLLANFSRAVDTEVDVVFDSAFIVYSGQDYEQAAERVSRLKEIHAALNPLELASPSNQSEEFFTLVSRFSAEDLKNYGQDAEAMRLYLDSSISKLKSDARLSILRAKDDFEKTGDGSRLGYLEKAKQSYDGGYYNRAIIYSRQIPGGISISGASFLGDFSWMHLVALVAVSGFVVFMLRRPKKENKKHVLRSIDFDTRL